jgi:hypothetical protein
MARDCETKLEYRIYKRTSEARSLGISKSPEDAPEPTKTPAEAKTELEAAVDRDCDDRNAEPVPRCEPCSLAGETEEVVVYNPNAEFQWTEDYVRAGPDGTQITGTALYTIYGTVTMEMKIYTKICAPRRFGSRLAMLEGFDFEVPAEVLANLDYPTMIAFANRDPKALAALGVKSAKGGKKA